MKQNLLTALAGTFLSLAICAVANAQQASSNTQSSKDVAFFEKSIPTSVLINLDPAAVNPKAKKALAKHFKNVAGAQWYETPNSFVAKFTSDGIDCRADFDKKGNWLYTIRTYDESKLPEDLRALVKSTYYDYSITLVQEIEKPARTFTYIVHIEGKKDLMNLRISDGEMEVWQKLNKSE